MKVKPKENVKTFSTIRFKDLLELTPGLKERNKRKGLYLEMAKCKLPLILTRKQYDEVVIGKSVGKWKPTPEGKNDK